jgi:nucleolar protein 14
MAGEDSDTEDERESAAAKKRRKGHAPQGDDIEDDFVLDEDLLDSTGFGTGLKQAIESDSEEEDGDDDEDDEGEESEYKDDDEDEDSQASDLEDDEENEITSRKATNTKALKDNQDVNDNETDKHENKLAAQCEIPYTFSVPEDHKAFLGLVQGYDADKQDIVVKRLRTIYHISLGAGNREILQVNNTNSIIMHQTYVYAYNCSDYWLYYWIMLFIVDH